MSQFDPAGREQRYEPDIAEGHLDDWMLQALFCDESEAFRCPVEPDFGQWVRVRLRAEKQLDAKAWLLFAANGTSTPMERCGEDELFTWYEARLQCGFEPIAYRIYVECAGARRGIVYQRADARWADGDGLQRNIDGARWAVDTQARPDLDFRIVPGCKTPAWARGALQYQIFPDRFANGNAGNDVVDREYAYDDSPVRKIRDWHAPPATDDYRCFYGGDLQGVAANLDYLQSLGVEAIYLNPVFVSPSSHKYDTQDYRHIDPHLAVISDDEDSPLAEGDCSNRSARQYIRRTTSLENLERSDGLFAELCGEIHRRGMKIILDGVFNHCGSFHRWMDREGIYQLQEKGAPGAYQSDESPLRRFFRFEGSLSDDYETWCGFPTLPKLDYEQSLELRDEIIGIARHWAMPPYSIDGWRLDIAADLGHSEQFNHEFWQRFRKELKRVNPELLILAEHYGNPAPWLQGDQWDTVMNYDAFMEPLTFFLTGMEKHSDARDDSLYQDGRAFCATMRETMARFSWSSLLCAMNELSNHDHSRFLTRTNRTIGRTGTVGAAAAGEGIDKRVLREAIVVQMTWPGAPTIYYGDEAGQVGWTDPDCRRAYPWGREDEGLVELHRALARLRKEHPCLRKGSLAMLGGGWGWIAFGRFLGDDRIAVLCNNADEAQEICVRARALGMPDGCRVESCLETQAAGFGAGGSRYAGCIVKEGLLRVGVPERSAVILKACDGASA